MSGENSDSSAGSSKLLAYLQLFRAPNVFTAIADVAMGFVFVAGSLEPVEAFACLAVASCLLYTAGMILNDVYDFDVDLRERPWRPLPSGRISRRRAQWLGYGMLACGVLLASSMPASLIAPRAEALSTPCSAIAFLLALCVIAYDKLLKRTPLGPFAMGACRFFNVLLGMSLRASGELPTRWFDESQLLVAGGIGVYITGVTWFARTEAKASSRLLLAYGVGLMVTGVVMLAFLPRYAPPELAMRFRIDPLRKFGGPEFVWPMALFLLTLSTWRRCMVAVANPSPAQVQAAVKQSILSLIVLDASVVLLIADWPYAVGILALMVPTLLLGKWVYST